MANSTPADIARAHCLQQLALYASDIADARAQAGPQARPKDRQYLDAFIRTARSVADRLRASPGYSLEEP